MVSDMNMGMAPGTAPGTGPGRDPELDGPVSQQATIEIECRPDRYAEPQGMFSVCPGIETIV